MRGLKHSVSFARYYATQIRSLCGLATPPRQEAETQVATVMDPFDFSFLLNAPYALDASVTSDPILLLLEHGLGAPWQ